MSAARHHSRSFVARAVRAPFRIPPASHRAEEYAAALATAVVPPRGVRADQPLQGGN